MFRFGRKKITAPVPLDEKAASRMRAIVEIHRKYPGSVPRSGNPVWSVAAELAKIITGHYSAAYFEDALVRDEHIEESYPSKWSGANALVRWYAFGLICLTQCARTGFWTDSLTPDVGLEVYQAALELTWAFWAMPDSIRQQVDFFVRSNLWDIHSSLANVIDDRSKAVWFIRYSERMVRGANPPWDLYAPEQSQSWRDKFPETLFKEADAKVGLFLQCSFEDTAKCILSVIGSATHGVITPTTPPEVASIWDHSAMQSRVKPPVLNLEEESELDSRLDPILDPTPERVRDLYEAWQKGKLSEALERAWGQSENARSDEHDFNMSYRVAAEEGDADAQFNLGLRYELGQEVPQDYAQAAGWYHKAAVQGCADAQHNLGLLYCKGRGVSQDYLQGGSWYRKAADQGCAEAQFKLGLLYYFGRGFSRDYTESARLFRQAAEQGHADAQENLGIAYKEGQGVPCSITRAQEWFRNAAEQGNPGAQNNLGLLYIFGHGVPEDHSEAARWFRKAAEQGDTVAQNNLGGLYYFGEGTRQSFPDAYFWLCLAAMGKQGADRLEAERRRDEVSANLTRIELSEIQMRISEWISANPKSKGT